MHEINRFINKVPFAINLFAKFSHFPYFHATFGALTVEKGKVFPFTHGKIVVYL